MQIQSVSGLYKQLSLQAFKSYCFINVQLFDKKVFLYIIVYFNRQVSNYHQCFHKHWYYAMLQVLNFNISAVISDINRSRSFKKKKKKKKQ